MVFRPFQDPQFSLGSLQEELQRLMERMWHAGVSMGPFDGQQWGPPIDMYDCGDHYLLHVELPGVDAGDVEVSHVGLSLTVSGEKRRPSTITSKDRAVRGERRYGTFSRSVELPNDVDASRLSARCLSGVLEIVIPKNESAKPKTVKVQVAEG